MSGSPPTAAERARASGGTSADAILALVEGALAARRAFAGTLVDVGCGTGNFLRATAGRFARAVGVDVVRYPGFPDGCEWVEADLDGERPIPLPAGAADVVVAVETIEHLENPRRFLRELVRLARDGGWVLVTTPNQLSLLSLACLLVKRRFAAFQDVHYPAHRTALLEVDLRRMAGECALAEVAIVYSGDGRIPGTARHWPGWLARRFPRALSDNVLLAGRKGAAGGPG